MQDAACVMLDRCVGGNRSARGGRGAFEGRAEGGGRRGRWVWEGDAALATELDNCSVSALQILART